MDLFQYKTVYVHELLNICVSKGAMYELPQLKNTSSKFYTQSSRVCSQFIWEQSGCVKSAQCF